MTHCFVQGIDDDSILQEFPSTMRINLILQSKRCISQLFRQFGEDFQRAIAPRFRLRIFLPEDFIFQVNNVICNDYEKVV